MGKRNFGGDPDPMTLYTIGLDDFDPVPMMLWTNGLDHLDPDLMIL